MKVSYLLLMVVVSARGNPTALPTRPSHFTRNRQKDWLCPALPSDNVDPFAIDRCWFDQDCSGLKKCCQTILGKSCVLPMKHRKELMETNKNGNCPTVIKLNGSSAQRCTTDFDCIGDKKCCLTAQGAICVSPAQSSAPRLAGQCPTAGQKSALQSNDKCAYDSDCTSGKRCCNTTSGKNCLKPIYAPSKYEKNPEVQQKPGRCPLSITGTGTLVYRCLYDTDCDGEKKCCDSKTGKNCMTPETDYQMPSKQGHKCSLKYANSATSIHCTTDEDCPGKRPCCRTPLGKICLPPQFSHDSTKTRAASQQLGLAMDDPFGRCNDDGQCQQPRKCTQTAKGKYCLLPHNATIFSCPDGYKAVQTCSINSNCPHGYSCYKTYCCKHHQEKLYHDKTEKTGFCPLIYGKESGTKVFQCYLDSHCPLKEKCCDTRLGKSCLMPLT